MIRPILRAKQRFVKAVAPETTIPQRGGAVAQGRSGRARGDPVHLVRHHAPVVGNGLRHQYPRLQFVHGRGPSLGRRESGVPAAAPADHDRQEHATQETSDDDPSTVHVAASLPAYRVPLDPASISGPEHMQ